MKKMNFAVLFMFIFLIATANFSNAFELYGCWKSDQKYPLNILKFDKNTYYYGRNSLPAKFSIDGVKYIVTFNVDSEIHIFPDGDNVIRVTYPTPALPQNIIYKRVTEEERTSLIKKR